MKGKKTTEKKDPKTNADRPKTSFKAVRDNGPEEKKYLKYIPAFAVLCVFLMAVKNDFLEWDDQLYVYENGLLATLSAENFRKLFSTAVSANYHPVTMLSLFLNKLILGGKSSGFIFVNILLHAINSILVYRLAFSLKPNTWIALAVALLWAIHPMHVEAVVWISERKGLLSSLFYLLSLLSYIKYLNGSSSRNYGLVWIWFILACLSKGTAATLPAVLILVDYWFADSSFNLKKAITAKLSFFLFSALIIWIAANTQKGGDFYGVLNNLHPFVNALDQSNYGLMDNLLFGAYGFVVYCIKLILPFSLHHYYPYPNLGNERAAQYLLSFVVFVVVLILIFTRYKKNKTLFFGMAFFLISISPVLKFITISSTILSERYTYLPYFGLIFMVAVFLHEQLNEKIRNTVVAVFLLICVYQDFSYIPTWKNTFTIWENAYKYEKNNPFCGILLVTQYEKQGDGEKIVTICRDLEKQNFNAPEIYYYLGKYSVINGNIPQANAYASKAVDNKEFALDRKNTKLFYYLKGTIAEKTGELNTAAGHFTSAIQLDSLFNQAIVHRGDVYRNTNQFQKALTDYDILVNRSFSLDTVYNSRAVVKYNLNNLNGAIADLKMAIMLNPRNTEAQNNLKILFGN